MIKLHRILWLLLVLAGTIAVSGCGDDSDSEVSPVREDVETTRDERGVWYITGPRNAGLTRLSRQWGMRLPRTGCGNSNSIDGQGVEGCRRYWVRAC